MTAIKKPKNRIIESLSVDTLRNVLDCLLFVNDYITQLSETEEFPSRETFYGLNRHLDHTIEAINYEKKKLTRSLKRSSRREQARKAQIELKALDNPVTKKSKDLPAAELIQLICPAYFDLHSAYLEFFRVVESSGKDITFEEGKTLPVYTQSLVERSQHIQNALEFLEYDLKKTGSANDD